MTPAFGPGWGNDAIRGIVEVSLPETVPFRPETPGWWLLSGALLIGVGRIVWRHYRRYRRNAYRREALFRLDDIRRRLHRGERAALRELAPLLRATFLHATERGDKPPPSGAAWQQGLDAMAPDLAPLPAQRLHELAYAPLSESSATGAEGLIDSLAQWIERHHARFP